MKVKLAFSQNGKNVTHINSGSRGLEIFCDELSSCNIANISRRIKERHLCLIISALFSSPPLPFINLNIENIGKLNFKTRGF